MTTNKSKELFNGVIDVRISNMLMHDYCMMVGMTGCVHFNVQPFDVIKQSFDVINNPLVLSTAHQQPFNVINSPLMLSTAL